MTVVFSGLFIVTILSQVAALFGDPRAPIAQLLDRTAGWLMGGEVAGILLAGFLALVVDRRQTLGASPEAARPPTPSESPHEQAHPGGD